jgi:hypothetical protein
MISSIGSFIHRASINLWVGGVCAGCYWDRYEVSSDEASMSFVARIPQLALGFVLAYAGAGHLTSSRVEFQAQVPGNVEQECDLLGGFNGDGD